MAGIVRTVELGGLDNPNFTCKSSCLVERWANFESGNCGGTDDTAPLIVRSAVEIAVIMVCIVIPIVRPLYRRIRESTRSPSSYQKHSAGGDWPQRDSSSLHLQTVGGSSMHGGGPLTPNDLLKRDMKLGLKTLAITQVISTKPGQEEIEMLGEEYRNSVKVTGDVSVSRE